MRLIVDTNILLTQFWKNSFTKKLFSNKNLELFSPEFALEEINIHEREILDKTKISKQEFIKLRLELSILINFVNVNDYNDKLNEALKLMPDLGDIDFLALALKLNCPIWSNNQHFKKQNKIKVFTTKELMNILMI